MKSPALVAVAAVLAAALSPTTLLGTSANAVTPDRNGLVSGTTEVANEYTLEQVAPSHNYTQAQAVAFAQRFNAIVAMPVSFQKYVSAMKAANPNLTLLAYSNAMFGDPLSTAAGLPESAFAHDASGNRIKSNNFGLTLMEPASPAWRTRSVQNCQTRITQGGYDGCFEDMLTMAVFAPQYVTALPIDPSTGTTYTATAWRSQLIQVGNQFVSQLPGSTIVGNVIGNGYSYWRNAAATSRPIAAALPASQMEEFLRAHQDPATKFPTLSEWLDNVNTIVDMESMGRAGLFSTKLWTNPTAAQTKQWEAYSMASFLMAANGHSSFAFSPAQSQAGVSGQLNPYPIAKGLGTPTGAMATSNGLYKRQFANGLALVNPDKLPLTVTLTGAATDLDGNTVTQFTLPPFSGQVLRPVSGVTNLDASAAVITQGQDTTPPQGTIGQVAQGVGSGPVTITGTATDNVNVASISIAIYSYAKNAWYRGGSTFGPYQKLAVSGATLPSKSANWSFSAQLPPGNYGVGLKVTDTTTNVQSPPPWVKFTVS